MALSVLLLPPTVAMAEVNRDFAVCLTITPGLGAAYLGHPVRGTANFLLDVGGWTVIGVNAGKPDRGGAVALGVGMVAVAYIWAFVDGTTLDEPDYNHGLPPWRPPTCSTSTVERTHIDLSSPLPPSMAPAAGGRIFMQTQRAGLQEIRVGIRAKVTLGNGDVVVGTITEASEKSMTLDVGTGTPRVIPSSDVSQVYRTR